MEQSLRNAIKDMFQEWQNKPFPSAISRTVSARIPTKASDNVLAVIWPRRAGKTYFMYQIMQDLIHQKKIEKTDILFMDFEDYRLLELKTKDISEIFTIFYELYGKYPQYLFFDEIQNIKQFWKVIRTFHNDGYRIVISGSSSKLLLCEISTELRGRYSQLLMLPFSFSEMVTYAGIEVRKISHTAQMGGVETLFNEYMQFGGFPKVIQTSNTYEKLDTLQEYYTTMFYRDLLERYSIGDKQALEYLMKYLLSLFSSLFSLWKFAKYLETHEVNVSKATLSTYLAYLKEVLFVIECSKFSPSPKVQIVNPKKIYLIDPWFIRLGIKYSENKGLVLENIVAIELFRRGEEFYYFQDKGECDFVLKDKMGFEIKQAIQVTWELNFHTQERELAGILQVLERSSLKEWRILTYNQEEERKENWYIIHVLPVWKWIINHL